MNPLIIARRKILYTIAEHLAEEPECQHSLKQIMSYDENKENGWVDFHTNPTTNAIPTNRSQSITGNVLTRND